MNVWYGYAVRGMRIIQRICKQHTPYRLTFLP